VGARPPREGEEAGQRFSLALILPILPPACSPLAAQPEGPGFFGKRRWEPGGVVCLRFSSPSEKEAGGQSRCLGADQGTGHTGEEAHVVWGELKTR